MKKQDPFRSGFNLLETLIASALLAGAVMTISTLGARSMTAVRIDRETEKAWELADFQLMIIDSMGIGAFLETGKTEGKFQQDENYSWNVAIQETEIQSLYAVRIQVSWISGSESRQIACEVRLCDTTEMVLPESQEAPMEAPQ